MKTKVESFQLDHRKVRAPYVRKCCVLAGRCGDHVSKFDLRFLQPNVEAFGTAAMHGLEHLLAHELRQELDGVIDLSPMGCRTGFYLTLWDDCPADTVRDALVRALTRILDATVMPAANAIQCGNYRDLSLFGAQEYAKLALERGFDVFVPTEAEMVPAEA